MRQSRGPLAGCLHRPDCQSFGEARQKSAIARMFKARDDASKS